MRMGANAIGLVVVIDDFEDAADALAELLRSEGFDVHVAYSGFAGLRLIERVRPQVAIIDLAMADLDGREVAKSVRLAPWGTNMRLIALTGLAIPAGSPDVLAAGYDECLIKPADADALIAALLKPSAPSNWC